MFSIVVDFYPAEKKVVARLDNEHSSSTSVIGVLCFLTVFLEMCI
jgi:hypothetical protein